MISWTETTTGATDADAYSDTSVDTTTWAYEAADLIIDNIEDFAYVHEERGHFNFLFRNMFKERFFLILQVHIRSMFFCYRLLFSISGWLNKKAKSKKGK